MTEKNFTPDYARLEVETQNNPAYEYGRLWQDADEKVQKIKVYLDDLYERTGSINWDHVANINRLNEYLDLAIQLIGVPPKN